VGARAGYVLLNWNIYRNSLAESLNIRGGGAELYGALIGAMLIAWLYCQIRRISFSAIGDIIAPGLLLGRTVGVWGYFFNREIIGEYTESLLAMQMPLSSVRSGEVSALIRENLVSLNDVFCVQVHPLFLYESIWCLLLFLFILARFRRKKFSGEVLMSALAGYGLGQTVISWFRAEKIRIPELNIPVSVFISAVLFFVFCTAVITGRRMEKKRSKYRKERREHFYETQRKMEEEGEVSVQELLMEVEMLLQEEEDYKEAKKRKAEQREAKRSGREVPMADAEMGQNDSKESEPVPENSEQADTKVCEVPEMEQSVNETEEPAVEVVEQETGADAAEGHAEPEATVETAEQETGADAAEGHAESEATVEAAEQEAGADAAEGHAEPEATVEAAEQEAGADAAEDRAETERSDSIEKTEGYIKQEETNNE
ncbi:MAG: prolipoprotein diacylglyceryl transferase, partial [Blautia sp.]|nr:prolipoprotein diacylglyceryl transferase [Blautia sp.]